MTFKDQAEAKVKETLERMRAATEAPTQFDFAACHWCSGVMRETPTKGRLECYTCGAVSLCGRQDKVVHVGKGR